MLPPDKDDDGKKKASSKTKRADEPVSGEPEQPQEMPPEESEDVGEPAPDEVTAEDRAEPVELAEGRDELIAEERDEPVEVAEEPAVPVHEAEQSTEPVEVAEAEPYADRPAEYAAEAPRQSEPVTDAVAPPPVPPARSGGGFWPALLGALVGAAVGAGAVWYLLQQMPRAPDPELTALLDQQAAEIEAQADRVAAFEGELGTLSDAVGANDLSGALDTMRTDTEGRLGGLDEALTGLGGRLDSVEAGLGELDGRVGEIGPRLDEGDSRISELEARPIADPETANQVLRSEVADMRQEVEQAIEEAGAQVDTMRSELATAAEDTQAKVEAAAERAAELEAEAEQRAAAAEAEAQAAASAAEAQAALARVAAALDTGEPFGDALAALSGTADEVPEALAAAADSGVPTIGELREGFPDAAREALKESRVASTEGEPVNRVVAFLRTQTQARSLTPREGDTPDAVLSRAEAALSAGDVRAVLAELEALPDDGRAAMQGWIDEAEARAAAVDAAESLSQGMN